MERSWGVVGHVVAKNINRKQLPASIVIFGCPTQGMWADHKCFIYFSFIYYLLSNAVSSSDYLASNDRMISDERL
jgi:hypothetical protein